MTNGTYMCQPNCLHALLYITNNWASEGIRLTLAQYRFSFPSWANIGKDFI